MAHYALLDQNNIVVNVITGFDEDTLIDGKNPEVWYGEFHKAKCKRTSYNTNLDRHLTGGTPFRKNFAQIGMVYDESKDAFYWQQNPYESCQEWIFDQDKCGWVPPVPYPTDSNGIPLEELYIWSDEDINWIKRYPNPPTE